VPPLRLSRLAEDDLRQIGRYTQREWGIRQRNRYLSGLDRRLREIANNPGIGRPRNEIKAGLRSILYGSHIILYFVSGEAVLVARVLHKNMEIERHLPSVIDEDGAG
jgi:toxin ParE1/3/4